MKKSKKNYILIALVVLLLALAIGYAAFSANLNINGTANASGQWDVKFISATVNTPEHGTATITTTDKDSDTITVAVDLAYPGDGCTVTANIKNGGSVPAKLTEFKLTDDTGAEYANPDIDIIIPSLKTDGTEVIAAGETCPVTFGIKWNTESEKTEATAKFKISFTYEQDTTEVDVQADHGTHTK